MTGITVRTVLPIMAVIILMAGMAVVGSTHENAIDMTALAGRVRVLTGQLESGQVVVECRWCPAGGGMAATATYAVLAVVSVILLVAGIAIRGCP